MTAPEDDLEQALRRALSAAVDGVEPGSDGLERIRARTSRPPRPWLLATVSAVVERGKNWVWRGHWAWPRFSRPASFRVSSFPMPRGRFAGARGNWLRPGAVLAGAGLLAAVTLAVTPLRQAIVQASSAVLTGGQTTAVLGTGTDGGGALTGNGTRQDGRQSLSSLDSSAVAGHSGSGTGHAARGSRCAPLITPRASAVSSVVPFATLAATGPPPADSAATTPTPCPAPSTPAVAAPRSAQSATSSPALPTTTDTSHPAPTTAAPTATASSSPSATTSPSPSTGATSTPPTTGATPSPTPSGSGTGSNGVGQGPPSGASTSPGATATDTKPAGTEPTGSKPTDSKPTGAPATTGATLGTGS